MNKAVILIFLIIVGAVLIGIPLYRFYNPEVLPGYVEQQEAEAAAVDPATLQAKYAGSTWTTSHTVNLDFGYGQAVPVVVDFEVTFAAEGKLKCKGHFFSDVALPPDYAALKAQMEQGLEGTWEVSTSGELIKFNITNPFAKFSEINAVYPFSIGSLQVLGDSLIYSPAAGVKYELKRFL